MLLRPLLFYMVWRVLDCHISDSLWKRPQHSGVVGISSHITSEQSAPPPAAECSGSAFRQRHKGRLEQTFLSHRLALLYFTSISLIIRWVLNVSTLPCFVFHVRMLGCRNLMSPPVVGIIRYTPLFFTRMWFPVWGQSKCPLTPRQNQPA